MSSKPARKQARTPGTRLWIQGLACGAALTLATPATVLALLLLAPSLAALLLDAEPGRPCGRTTLLAGAAAAIAPVFRLWSSGGPVGGALVTASDPQLLLACWLAQAGAWLATQMTPLVIRLVLETNAAAQTARLRRQRASYEKDWGVPPVEETPPN